MENTITNMELSFEKQFNGYDKGQVDSYIANIAGAYQTAYDEYNALSEKYNDVSGRYIALTEAYKLLEKNFEAKAAQPQSVPNADIIAKMLMDTESLAQKIISDANTEAAKITAEALTDAKRITDDAYTEKATIKLQSQQAAEESAAELTKAKEAARIIMEEAGVEAAVSQEKSKRMLEEARLEALQITTRAKYDREQADDVLRNSIDKLQGMLAPRLLTADAPEAYAPQLADAPVRMPLRSIGIAN